MNGGEIVRRFGSRLRARKDIVRVRAEAAWSKVDAAIGSLKAIVRLRCVRAKVSPTRCD
jgi:hypothetical protein